MKTCSIMIFSCMVLLNFSCESGKNSTGLEDQFSNADGWVEVSPDNDTISPSLNLESKEGSLTIYHKFRTLEEAHKKWDWIENEIDYSTNLRKNYEELDLDKYHYVVLNVKEKGSSSYFDINGYTTKLGYTTGITVIDLPGPGSSEIYLETQQ